MNIQGLNQIKYTILEELYLGKESEHNIVCLTETQQRQDKITMGEKIVSHNAMREKDGEEKKGGGLLIVHRENKRINFEKMENKNKNLLEMKGKCYGQKLRIVLVYFDSDKSKEGGQKRNKALKIEVEKAMGSAKENNEAILVLGDFNGHIGLLGHQKANQQGKLILKWIEEDGLSLLNMDENCEGVYTWSRGDQKSVIDYAFVNKEMYNHFIEMKIDEKKEEFADSDHHMITIKFKFQKKGEKRKNKWIKREYFTSNKKDLKIFREKLEQSWRNNKIETISEMDKSILKIAKETLLRVYKRKETDDIEEREEKPWMNDNIRKEIKIRREINRKKRNTEDEKEREVLEEKYKEQKEVVKKLIREGIESYEIKITKEIKEDGNSGRKLWENIYKLLGKEKKTEEEMRVYIEDEKELSKQEILNKVPKYWREYLGNEINEIIQAWNNEVREEVKYKFEEEKILEPSFIKIAGGMFKLEGRPKKENERGPKQISTPTAERKSISSQKITPMELQDIGKDTVSYELERLKSNKAPGPDSLKPVLYKEIGKSEFCKEEMARVYNNQLYSEQIPESWKESKTKLIAKTKKPTVKDFRPIALANISYKLFMSMVKNQLESHLIQNNLTKDNQAGFTKGGRIEDNLFILQHLVEKSFKQNKTLIVISIDFSKAYDSINRKRMIETMIKYKIHPNIIDIVANVYQDDFTKIMIGDQEEKIKITSGIKQGCTGSTALFKLITYEIIKEIERHGEGIEIDNNILHSLFFADDSLTLANTKENAMKNLKILTKISESFGLRINKEKSNILVYNSNENIKEIEGIQVTEKIRYLGIIIDNKKDLFESHRQDVLKRAKIFLSLMHKVLGKCVNRMLVGKTYWKCMIIPSLLHGTGVMTFNEKEIKVLQGIENTVYREILGARKFTPISALRGEIGSSLMITRFMESKILLTKNILTGTNNLTKQILNLSRRGKSNTFNTTLKQYLKKVNINYEELSSLSNDDVKDRARKWDTERWKENMKSKSSLMIYRKFKLEIKEVKYYDNRESSNYLFQARSNTLDLNTRKRFTGGDTKCEMCSYENEDLIHFLIDCKGLEHKRSKQIFKKCVNQDKEVMAGNILFGKNNEEEIKIMIEEMWNLRLGKKIEKGDTKEVLKRKNKIKTTNKTKIASTQIQGD